MKLSFIIDGPPVPKARARKGRNGRFFTPERTRRYERHVASCARAALWTSGFRSMWPMEGKYMLRARLYMPDARRRDSDNVAKSLSDAMIGVLFADDHRVGFSVDPWEVDRENPRAEVEVEVL